jgi:hypothetical protein|tara:strand:- start:187 stop:306 length:120 start_codon:yes stop_codon:yes gene_type:complete
MELNEFIAVIGIAATSFLTGYLIADLQSFRRYIKENCLK